MDFASIRLEQSPSAVATVTLNRPDSLNAPDAALIDEPKTALETLPGPG